MDNLKENDLPEFQGILREAEARAEGDYILGFNYSPLLTLTKGIQADFVVWPMPDAVITACVPAG